MRNRVLIVALAAVLGGCGSDQPVLSKGSADELHAQVAKVRAAAADGDRAKALQELDALATDVRSLQDEGSLAAADATALRRGIGRARRKVREEIAPAATATPTPTATATPVPTATPAPPQPPGKAKGKKEKGPKGKGGKGKGH
jgi:hypothetical protein